MKTAQRIAEILAKRCPAFSYDKDCGLTVWHCCYCKAQTSGKNFDNLTPCTCVWHQTDTCIAGTWPQLAFINEKRQLTEQKANYWLAMAKKEALKEPHNE